MCALQTPTAHVNLAFEYSQSQINKVKITWIFSETFTDTLYYGYDLNENKHFEPRELLEIKNTLISYISDKNHLSFISYYDENETQKQINIKAENQKFELIDNQIHFSFTQKLNLQIKEKRVIKFLFEDLDGYFNFQITNKDPIVLDKLSLIPNANLNTAFFNISHQNIKTHEQNSTKKALKTPQKSSSQISDYYAFLSQKLQLISEKIKQLFIQSKTDHKALFLLIFFSFIYGLFHAIGPGHGKMLVGSYFLANGGGYLRAFLLCVKIAFIHVAGAFLLVLSSVFFIKIFITKLIGDISFYTNIIGGIIVFIIALYLLYKKIFHASSKASCECCKSFEAKQISPNKLAPQAKIANFTFKSPDIHKQDWLLAFGAGIIPCPGTIAIFVLAFSFGSYLSGFLSALSLSFGMSVVIFVASIFGNFIHQNAMKNFSKLQKIVEIIGILILILLSLGMIGVAFMA